MKTGRFDGCRAILFDFGGTLDADGEHWLDRFIALYGKIGLELPVSAIRHAFTNADRLCGGDGRLLCWGLRPLLRHHVRLQFQTLGVSDPLREAAIAEAFCQRAEPVLRRNADILRRLRRRYRLGLVSNFYGNVLALCREAGLSESLEVIIDSALLGVGKPDPAIFQFALERLQLPAGEVIFVGDSYERDMLPARSLGMRTIWLRARAAVLPPVVGPVDARISRLPQLAALLP